MLRFKKSHSGVPISEHSTLLEKLDAVHWDDLHMFRTVAASGSFHQAAAKLAVSVNTIRGRVARLEKALDTVLLGRSHKGISLSADGQAILDVTLDMLSSSWQLRRGAGNNVLVRQGEVRISCAESLGTVWLTPFLSDLSARLPEHRIKLQNEYNQNLIHTRDSDICIGYLRPNNPETIVTKIATVHQMPFASKKYLEQFGTPQSINDASDHRIILFDAPGVNGEAANLYLGSDILDKVSKLTFNTGYSFFWSVFNGDGIAVLPTYVRSLADTFTPIDVQLRFKFDIWLSFHRSGRDSIPIRETIAWLQSCFNPVHYPWFSESFIHPNEFEKEAAAVRATKRLF